MPLYEYQCEACKEHFELTRRVTDGSFPACPGCGSAQTRRVVSRSAFVLKGSGWYVTDYGTKSSGSADGNHPKGKSISTDSASSSEGSLAGQEESGRSKDEKSAADHGPEKSADRATDKSADKSNDRSSDRPNEKSSEKSSEKGSTASGESTSKVATP